MEPEPEKVYPKMMPAMVEAVEAPIYWKAEPKEPERDPHAPQVCHLGGKPEPEPVIPKMMLYEKPVKAPEVRMMAPEKEPEPKTGGRCTFAKYLWELDDSGNAVGDYDSRRIVKHGGAEGPEKKGNAWFGFDGSLGCWFFEVLGSGGFWLGVTTKKNFGPGYGMKGLFFGGPGNLSDGRSLVESGWGPRMEQGDVIGMRLEQKDGNTTLAFSKKGNGLGTAFDIQGWDEGKFVPAVSLEKPGQAVKVVKFESVENPSSLEEFNTVKNQEIPRRDIDIEGAWKLDRLGVENHVFEITKDPNGHWIVDCTVANSMSCALEGDGPEFKAGPVAGTMMMPPPHLEELEKEISALMEGITRVEFCFADGLVVTSGGKTFAFKEFVKVRKPATKERINWMNK